MSNPHVLDELVPYAQVVRIVTRSQRSDENLRDCAQLLLVTSPDALFYAEGDAAMQRGVGAYHESEDAPRHSAYRIPTVIIAMRCSPSVLPFRFRPQDGVVTHVVVEAAAGGLREGDAILSIDGQPLPLSEAAWLRSNFQSTRLTRRAHEKVAVAWVRVGTGRMDGDVEFVPNPRTYLAEPDGFRVDLPKPSQSQSAGRGSDGN